jgi:hypothetical protein
MTTAGPTLSDDMLSDAIAIVREAARKATRPALLRWIIRRAKVGIRAYGYGYDHQARTAEAIRKAFPEYARWLPGDTPLHFDHAVAIQRAGEVEPADFRREEEELATAVNVFGRVEPTAPVVPIPDGEPFPGGTADLPDDEEEECEYHDDEHARCTRCGGFPYERCSHDFECGECGAERDTCQDCGQESDCRHEWECQECGQPVELTGQE